MISAAPAAVRNAGPIFEVLKRELPTPCRLLEIGSGTGLHAVRVGAALPGVDWYPTEKDDRLHDLTLSLQASDGLLAARASAFDVDKAVQADTPFDAVFSCNTAHIMRLETVHNMFRRVGETAAERAVFLLYGPFKLDGRFTTASNEAFDATLQRKAQGMGIRPLEALDEFALEAGFERSALYAMPSNNLLAVWRR